MHNPKLQLQIGHFVKKVTTLDYTIYMQKSMYFEIILYT